MVFIISLMAAAIAFAVYFNARKRASKPESVFAGIGASVALFIAFLQFFTVIPAGSVGVVDFLGNVSNSTLKAGVNFVNPLANVEKFSVKLQEMKETMTVPSKEGLSVQVEISLQYRLSEDNVTKIYTGVELPYEETFLLPRFRSVVRNITAKYEAKALYTSLRDQLSHEIVQDLSRLVNYKGIYIEQAPLRQITLPPGLTAAIEEKLKAEQENQRMEFILKKESQEAERKRIEAKGIADFQDIVSKGISEQLLKWKGIEATEKLANSTNSKIIVIGSGKDGLPLILGGN